MRFIRFKTDSWGLGCNTLDVADLRVSLLLATRFNLNQELKSTGIDGALFVLNSGPFANLSEDFNHIVDLIAHEKAAAWLEKQKMNPCTARALFRQGLVQRLGLLVMCGDDLSSLSSDFAKQS